MPCSGPPTTSMGRRSGRAGLAERRAHPPQRLGDAPHGPAAEGIVAREGGCEGAAMASRPIISRAVVPLLPQSSHAAGAVHDPIPRPATTISAPSAGRSGTAHPSARSTAAVLRQSAPGSRPRSRLVPVAAALNMSARWVQGLVAGDGDVAGYVQVLRHGSHGWVGAQPTGCRPRAATPVPSRLRRHRRDLHRRDRADRGPCSRPRSRIRTPGRPRWRGASAWPGR